MRCITSQDGENTTIEGTPGEIQMIADYCTAALAAGSGATCSGHRTVSPKGHVHHGASLRVVMMPETALPIR